VSYVVSLVYSFRCDRVNCTQAVTCMPDGQQEPGEYTLLLTAIRMLRAIGWDVRGKGARRTYLCPDHRGEATGLPPVRQMVTCPECSRKFAVRADGMIRAHMAEGARLRCGGSGQAPS
jgi:hypothetical protein